MNTLTVNQLALLLLNCTLLQEYAESLVSACEAWWPHVPSQPPLSSLDTSSLLLDRGLPPRTFFERITSRYLRRWPAQE